MIWGKPRRKTWIWIQHHLPLVAILVLTLTPPLTKITGGTPEVCSDKSLTLLIFDNWHLTFEHLNIWTIEHSNIWTLEHWNIGTLKHWNIGTFERLNIWTFEHLQIWQFKDLFFYIWTFEHLIIWHLNIQHSISILWHIGPWNCRGPNIPGPNLARISWGGFCTAKCFIPFSIWEGICQLPTPMNQ